MYPRLQAQFHRSALSGGSGTAPPRPDILRIWGFPHFAIGARSYLPVRRRRVFLHAGNAGAARSQRGVDSEVPMVSPFPLSDETDIRYPSYTLRIYPIALGPPSTVERGRRAGRPSCFHYSASITKINYFVGYFCLICLTLFQKPLSSSTNSVARKNFPCGINECASGHLIHARERHTHAFPAQKNMHRFSQLARGTCPRCNKAHEPQAAPGSAAQRTCAFPAKKRKLCALWWAETGSERTQRTASLPVHAAPSRARPFFIPVCLCLYGRSAGAAGPARRLRPKPRPRSGAHF